MNRLRHLYLYLKFRRQGYNSKVAKNLADLYT
jgi:hypothetical protein